MGERTSFLGMRPQLLVVLRKVLVCGAPINFFRFAAVFAHRCDWGATGSMEYTQYVVACESLLHVAARKWNNNLPNPPRFCLRVNILGPEAPTPAGSTLSPESSLNPTSAPDSSSGGKTCLLLMANLGSSDPGTKFASCHILQHLQKSTAPFNWYWMLAFIQASVIIRQNRPTAGKYVHRLSKGSYHRLTRFCSSYIPTGRMNRKVKIDYG